MEDGQDQFMSESTEESMRKSILRALSEKAHESDNRWVLAQVLATEVGLSADNPTDARLLSEQIESLEDERLIEVSHELNPPYRFAAARIALKKA